MSTSPSPAGRVIAWDGVAPSERLYRIFVRDLVLDCRIGAYAHERLAPQPVRINVDLRVREADQPRNDDLGNVLSYDDIVGGIRALVAKGHINLAETLAEEIAAICLADPRVAHVLVKVEKLTVQPDAASVGVEIERHRQSHPTVADLFHFSAIAAARQGQGRGGGSS